MLLSSFILDKVVVDTGPLYEFLILKFADKTRRPHLKNYLKYVKDESKQDRLIQCFSQVKSLWTTPGVISEINAHIRYSKRGPKLKPYELETFWDHTILYFRLKNVSEEIIRLLEQPQSLVEQHGPTDISILELARRQSGTVFTTEGPLYSVCTAQMPSINCLLLDKNSGNIIHNS